MHDHTLTRRRALLARSHGAGGAVLAAAPLDVDETPNHTPSRLGATPDRRRGADTPLGTGFARWSRPCAPRRAAGIESVDAAALETFAI